MIKFKYWNAIAASALLAACSADDFGGATGEGRIQLQLTVDTQPIGTPASRAALEDLTLDDMKVRLTHANGTVHNYGSVAEFENEEKFDIGDYNIDVYYGNEKDCGFEKPYVYGTAALTVHHGETTEVDVEAKLANSMVTVTYSDNVSKFFSNFGVTLTSDNGNPVEYPVDTRPVFVTPGNISMRLDYTIGAGDTQNVPVTDFKAEPQHHYRINVDINGGEVGDAVMTISFDDTMQQHELDIPLENLTAPDVPVLSASGFDQGTALPVVAGIMPEGDLYCGVIARGGLKSLMLTTEGSDKIGISWIPEVDLVSASEQQQTDLKKCGLTVRGLWGNGSGETADLVVVDFSKVVSTLPDATEGDIKFTLKATDKFGQAAEQDLTLQLSVAAYKMVLSDVPAEVWEGEDAFTMTLTYNGGDPSKKLQVMYNNALGNPEAVPATFTATGDNTYTVAVNPSQPWGHDFDIYVSETQGIHKSNIPSVEYVKMPTLAVSDVNVWATKAYVTIQDAKDKLKYYDTENLSYSIDGTNFDKTMTPTGSSHLMLIDGLTPGQTYQITARNPKDPTNVNRKLKTLTFTTEAATQLPNGNLDADVTNDGHESHWENVVFQGWGTNNPMTTSQGSNFAYVKISGTKQVDGYKGKAACIKTQGWGSGNTATGSNGTSGKCKYIDAGLLHLGSSRTIRPEGYSKTSGSLETTDLNCGIQFESRPTSLSFWFKYEPVSKDDRGEAVIYIYDVDGKIITQGKSEMSETTTYTQCTINLPYVDNAKKAAKIYVRFLSTNKSTALTRNKGWLKGPGFGNLDRGEFAGAALYIDEVTLNY